MPSSPPELNLKEELARQSLLLEFISECAGVASIPTLMETLSLRLHWIAHYSAGFVLIANAGESQLWAVPRDGAAHMLGSIEALSAGQQALLARTRGSAATTVFADGQSFMLGLPLGGSGKPLGILGLGRDGAKFSHSDLRHLQHACNAIGTALVRMAGAQVEARAQHEIRLAESRMRQATRVAALFLWDVGGDGVRRYADEVALLLGFDWPGAVSEAAFMSAIHPDDRAGERASFEVALADPHRVHSWQFRLRGRDDVQRVVSCAGQAIPMSDAGSWAFAGVLSDVTATVLARSLAEDRALLAEQMIGIVSHDLRNPLSAILMGATVLGRGEDLAPQKARVLRSVESAGHRARRLVDELLDFTLVRVGRGLQVNRRRLDLHELVSGCVDELSLAYSGRQLVHRCVGEGEVFVDGDRLEQLVGNLVSNAMHYGDASLPVTVTSTVAADTAGISVHNMGPPIAPELQESIFEPLVRGALPGGAARSVGLGLFIVRAIAQAHGGDVRVDSSADTGTTFQVWLAGPSRDAPPHIIQQVARPS